MKNIFKMTAIAALVLASSACTRIETGEVGVRVNAARNILAAGLRRLAEGIPAL